MIINLEVKEMLEALCSTENPAIRKKAKSILAGKATIEEEKSYAGGFFGHVLNGNFGSALANADGENRVALLKYLVKRIEEHNFKNR